MERTTFHHGDTLRLWVYARISEPTDGSLVLELRGGLLLTPGRQAGQWQARERVQGVGVEQSLGAGKARADLLSLSVLLEGDERDKHRRTQLK